MDGTVNVLSSYGRERTLKPWVLALLVMSFLLQLIGFVSPWWLNIEIYGQMSYRIGLWFGILCTTYRCQTIDVDTLAMLMGHYQDVFIRGFLEYQIEASIAVFACILAIIRTVQTMRTNRPLNKMTFYIGFVLCASSAILSLVASGQFGIITVNAHYLLKRQIGKSPFRMPYSLLLTGTGGILALLASMAELFHTCCQATHQRNRERMVVMKTDENGDTTCVIPMIPQEPNADHPPVYVPPVYMGTPFDSPPLYEK